MTQIVVAQRMWQRRDTAANWTSANPVLAAGEIGVQLGASPVDTKIKIGDGTTPWVLLPYYSSDSSVPVNLQTATSYTYVAGDKGRLVSHSNASSIAASLPQATAAFGAGWFCFVQNRGAGGLTITPASPSNIDGAVSLVLSSGQGVLIASNGADYYTMRGVGGGGGGGGGIGEAPVDGKTYGRRNGVWVDIGGTGWQTAFVWEPTAYNSGWENYTLRVVMAASAATYGSKFRLTVSAPPDAPLTIGKMYVGRKAPSGDSYDFETTPLPVLFSGAASVTIPAGGFVVSDEVVLELSGLSGLVVSCYFAATPAARIPIGSQAGMSYTYKVGDDAATVNASGYSTVAGGAALIRRLEVFR